ncbi:MAG: hypothetical protein M3N29_05950 [Chloroflexota bacterium]|nr:hypothetical protein [Chloroflexota bacterium]
MSHHTNEHGSARQTDEDSEEQLRTTAEHWRQAPTGEADESADEVARGAEQAAEQPDFGREGS